MLRKQAQRALRLGRAPMPQAESRGQPPERTKVVLPCGWGRLIAGHTFADPADVVLTAPMSLYAETFRKLRAAIEREKYSYGNGELKTRVPQQ